MGTIPPSEEKTDSKPQDVTDHTGGKSDEAQEHRRFDALTKRSVKWKKVMFED